MFVEWLENNLYGIITTILSGGGLFAYFTERKKRKIQEAKEASSAKLEEANALETIQLVYDKFVKDSLDRYAELKNQLDVIKTELQSVYHQLELVSKELEEEKERNYSLKADYEDLKRACEQYTKSKE